MTSVEIVVSMNFDDLSIWILMVYLYVTIFLASLGLFYLFLTGWLRLLLFLLWFGKINAVS